MQETSPVQELPAGGNDMHGLAQRVQRPDVLPVGEPDTAHSLQPRGRGRERGEGAPRRRGLLRRRRRAARRVDLRALVLRRELGNLPLELDLALLQLPYLPQQFLRCCHRRRSGRCCIKWQASAPSRGSQRWPKMAPLEASETHEPPKKAPFINFLKIPLIQEARAQSNAFCSFPGNLVSKFVSILLPGAPSELILRATTPPKKQSKNSEMGGRSRGFPCRSSLIPCWPRSGLPAAAFLLKDAAMGEGGREGGNL